MNLKKLGVALLVVVALGAVMASSALAAAEYKETGGQWYTGASPGTKLSGSKSLTTTAVGEKQTLETTVAGQKLDITWTVWTCLVCTIQNPTSITSTIIGVTSLTAIVVTEPSTCSIKENKITTNNLTATLGMNTAGTVATLKIAPTSGTTFATVKLEGASCPIAGTYLVKGVQYAQANNATGVFAASQGVTLTKAIQESASGEAAALKFGENAAVLTGALNASIGGTEWAGKEK